MTSTLYPVPHAHSPTVVFFTALREEEKATLCYGSKGASLLFALQCALIPHHISHTGSLAVHSGQGQKVQRPSFQSLLQIAAAASMVAVLGTLSSLVMHRPIVVANCFAPRSQRVKALALRCRAHPGGSFAQQAASTTPESEGRHSA